MEPDELYQHAIVLLARKDYSNGEIRRALHHLSDDTIAGESAIGRLRDNNYLDNRRIAENMVSRFLRKQYGPVRIKQELRQKGIEQDVADAALNDSNADWFQVASDCRYKKFGNDQPADTKEKIRQMRYLQSRGFTMDMINEAMSSQED